MHTLEPDDVVKRRNEKVNDILRGLPEKKFRDASADLRAEMIANARSEESHVHTDQPQTYNRSQEALRRLNQLDAVRRGV